MAQEPYYSHREDDVEKYILRDQRFMLEQSREELEDGVDLLGSELLYKLQEAMVINQHEVDNILRSDDEKKQVHALLNRMMRKNSQQFNIFCACMDQAGMSLLRQRLLSNTVIGRCVNEVQEKLCKYFLESYSQVDMLSLHDEGHRVRLDQIYVPIKWVKYVNQPGEVLKHDLQAYTEIFQDTQDMIVRILVRGEPMAGKTTFLRKISFDWSKAVKVPLGSNKRDDLLGRYKICLPIILRLVKRGASLLDTAQSQMDFLKKRDQLTIQWLIDQDPSKVLIVCDGLDEYDLTTSADITEIIKGNILAECCCVVTSRGEGVNRIENWNTIFQVDAQLDGFGDKQINDYIQLFFGIEQAGEELQKLISEAKNESANPKNKYLYEMACNPGRLGILCLLWKEKRNLSNNRSDLYKEYICLLLKLAEERLYSSSLIVGTNERLSHHNHKLMNFGRLALQREENKKDMKIVFTIREVERVVGSDALKYGLLFKSHPVSRMQFTQVSFIHKTVQEWLAAFYLSKTSAWDELVYSDCNTFIADQSLHQFILSFNATYLQNLCECLFLEESQGYDVDDLITWGKNLDIEFSVGDILRRFIHVKGYDLYNRDIYNAQLQVNVPEDIELPAMEVQKLILTSNHLHGAGVTLGHLVLAMPACTYLDLDSCKLQATDVEALVEACSCKPLLIKQLELGCNDLQGAGVALGRLLLLMPSCTKLALKECGFLPPDITDIVATLGDVTLAIKTLSLWNNVLHGAGNSLGRMLMLMPACTYIHLGSCGLVQSDFDDLVAAIGTSTLPMEEMDITNNDISKSDPSFGRLCERLPHCAFLSYWDDPG